MGTGRLLSRFLNLVFDWPLGSITVDLTPEAHEKQNSRSWITIYQFAGSVFRFMHN
jgi:hypothetical protein